MSLPSSWVWRGHVSRSVVAALLVAHLMLLVWMFSSWTRTRLISFDFREVPDESALTLAPADQAAWHYYEDDPAELGRFRAIAEPIVAGAQSDGERLRRLGDYLYNLRRGGAPPLEGELRQGVFTVLDKLERGEPGSCAHMSAVLAAMWRSLGGHTRGVRWATVDGDVTHYGVELYSDIYRKWMYYDMNLNGYDEEQPGVPLSLATLRPNILTGQDLNFVASATLHDWTRAEFVEAIRSSPIEWYAMNNDFLYMEPARRFGRLNRFSVTLSKLPYPFDRILDNLFGRRDRRVVVAGRVQVAGLLTITGARIVVVWSVFVTIVCALTLRPAPHRTREAH